MLSGIALVLFVSKKITTPLSQLANALLTAQHDSDLPGAARTDEIGVLSRNLSQLLTRNHQFFVREQSFSRHCSHELRTPVAIIKNSISLLKLRSCNEQSRRRSISRIDDATNEMANLVETFLLLGRTEYVVKAQTIELGEMVEQIISRLQQSHPPDISTRKIIQQGHAVIACESIICQVLLTNIIRNAFVHSSSTIDICCDKGTITVSNDIALGYETSGYGYGLEIIERIAQRLACKVDATITVSHYSVTLQFK